MGHRAHSEFQGRSQLPDPSGRGAQNRVRIAQTAAKLIAEHGLTDWSLAKRKAARQLMLSEREGLPGDDEIESALTAYQQLFGGDAHTRRLRAQREEALGWMEKLAPFRPLLVGGVAAGWATAHSDIRLELVAADEKAVALALLNLSVSYRTLHENREGVADLWFEVATGGVRLTIRSLEAARQQPRRDRHGNVAVRYDAAQLAAVLEATT